MVREGSRSRECGAGKAGRTPTRGAVLPCLALAVLFGFGGCQGEPTKSQYVSAQVRAECPGLRGTEAQACRIAVIKKYANVPLEEMKSQFPPPEPPARPSCSLW